MRMLMRSLWRFSTSARRPPASHVLSAHLVQRGYPAWTSFFVRYRHVSDDQRGMSHFNWKVRSVNYHVLRTGCWPFIKYHCSRRAHQDLSVEDRFFRFVKLLNLGVPCVVYGVAAALMVTHREVVCTEYGPVTVFFLYKEDYGAQF